MRSDGGAAPRDVDHVIGNAGDRLPLGTVFALATSGLRVRLVRSLVTTVSVVLAIAFLSYTGFHHLTTRNLARHLGELEREVPRDETAVATAVATLAKAPLFEGMSLDARRQLAVALGMAEIFDLELEAGRVAELVRTSRIELSTVEADLSAQRQALASLDTADPAQRERRKQIEEQIPAVEARADALRRTLERAQPRHDELSSAIALGQWIVDDPSADRSAEDDAVMAETLIDALGRRRHFLLNHAATLAKLEDDALERYERLLALADAQGHAAPAGILRDVLAQERRKRDAARLRMSLRRAGIDPQRAIDGDPLDAWLAIMALLTCAVGIANAMLMSVTERVREIGTMKCLGAGDGLVVKVFLIESALVGGIGAGMGILLGVVVSLAAGVLQYGAMGITAFPVWQSWPVMMASIAAGLVLAVSGAVGPAYQAARMRPVDALRVDE